MLRGSPFPPNRGKGVRIYRDVSDPPPRRRNYPKPGAFLASIIFRRWALSIFDGFPEIPDRYRGESWAMRRYYAGPRFPLIAAKDSPLIEPCAAIPFGPEIIINPADAYPRLAPGMESSPISAASAISKYVCEIMDNLSMSHGVPFQTLIAAKNYELSRHSLPPPSPGRYPKSGGPMSRD